MTWNICLICLLRLSTSLSSDGSAVRDSLLRHDLRDLKKNEVYWVRTSISSTVGSLWLGLKFSGLFSTKRDRFPGSFPFDRLKSVIEEMKSVCGICLTPGRG